MLQLFYRKLPDLLDHNALELLHKYQYPPESTYEPSLYWLPYSPTTRAHTHEINYQSNLHYQFFYIQICY